MTKAQILAQSALSDEVRELVESGLHAGVTMPASWITHEIVGKHPRISGPDRDFYLLCAYKHVRTTVREVLGDYKDDPRKETPAQLLLEGYSRVQIGYLVDREDEQTIVPISQLTDEEIKAKIREYHAMASGCQLHAEELQRYMFQRRGSIE